MRKLLQLITITINVIVIPLKRNGTVACVCLALRIIYATAINWATMIFPLLTLLSALTHIMQICRNFDVANLLQYRAGFAPMLFQWSHSHMQRFSSRFPDKNRAIKRGLERKNRAIKKSRYVCQGSNMQVILFDRLVDRLGPVDLALFTLLSELVILNLNVKKGHTEFRGHLWCCTASYM